MDAWEKAQALIEKESFLGAGRFREAEKLLAAAAVDKELEAIRQRCAEPLDRLEQAHEQAQTELAAAEELAPKLAARLPEVEKAELSSAPYRPELEAMGALVEQARGLAQSDPIGALETLEQSRQRADAWQKWIDTVLDLRRKADEALERLEQASTAMNRRRSEGFLLTEPGSDPKPFLETGWEQQQSALQALDAGQTEPADKAVAAAFQAADSAQQAVEKTVRAKARCEEAFARRSAELRRADDAARLAQQRGAELERDFAPESWRDVSANLQNALSLISGATASLNQAALLTAAHVQHYQKAAGLVDQAEQQQSQAHTLLAAIERRLNELTELRRRCRDEWDALRRRSDTLSDILRRSFADRAQTNDRCREAIRLLTEWRSEAERSRADWQRLETRLKEVAKAVQDAEQRAQEDERLSRQAADALAAAQRQVQQSQAFSRHGFSADLASAQRTLDDAQRRLQAQNYEDAVRLANRAEQEARQALADAERRANERQAQTAAAAAQVATLAATTHAATAQTAATQTAATQPAAPDTWGSNSSQNSW
jgi:chromosome segregation ATPase